jgi:hypothetical protein
MKNHARTNSRRAFGFKLPDGPYWPGLAVKIDIVPPKDLPKGTDMDYTYTEDLLHIRVSTNVARKP